MGLNYFNYIDVCIPGSCNAYYYSVPPYASYEHSVRKRVRITYDLQVTPLNRDTLVPDILSH